MNSTEYANAADQFALLSTYCRLAAMFRTATELPQFRHGKIVADLEREMNVIRGKIELRFLSLLD